MSSNSNNFDSFINPLSAKLSATSNASGFFQTPSRTRLQQGNDSASFSSMQGDAPRASMLSATGEFNVSDNMEDLSTHTNGISGDIGFVLGGAAVPPSQNRAPNDEDPRSREVQNRDRWKALLEGEPFVRGGMLGYANPDIEQEFLNYAQQVGMYRFAALCGFLTVISASVAVRFSVNPADWENSSGDVIMPSTTTVRLFIAMSVFNFIAMLLEVILLFMWERSRDDNAVQLGFTAYREYLSVFVSVINLVYYGSFANYSHSVCHFVHSFDDAKAISDQCPPHIARLTVYCAFFIAIIGRPRFCGAVAGFLLALVAMTATMTLFEGHSTSHRVYEILTSATLLLVAAVVTFLTEADRRRQFELSLRSMMQQEEVKHREATLRGFLATVVPQRLCSRLLSGKKHSSDSGSNAVVVVTDVYDAQLVSSSLLPADAALAINRLAALSQLVCQRLDIDHIRSIGDATYVVCNFLSKHDHPCHLALAYALTLFGSTTLPIRSGCATGLLWGGVVGATCIRYDIFGPALEESHRLLTFTPPRMVHLSRGVIYSVGGDITGGYMGLQNSAAIEGAFLIDHTARIRKPEAPPPPPEEHSPREGGESPPDVSHEDGASEGISAKSVRHVIAPGGEVDEEEEEEEEVNDMAMRNAARYAQASCVYVFYVNPAVERAFVIFFTKMNRARFVITLCGCALILAVVLGCTVHDRSTEATVMSEGYPWDAALTASVALLILSIAIMVIAAFTKWHRYGSVEATLDAYDAAVGACFTLAMIGASLSRPALLSIDPSPLALAFFTATIFTVSTPWRQAGVCILIQLVMSACQYSFRPIYTVGTHAAWILQLCTALLAVGYVNRLSRFIFTQYRQSVSAQRELRNDQRFQESILRTRVPLNLAQHVQQAREENRKVAEFWVVEDMVAIQIQSKTVPFFSSDMSREASGTDAPFMASGTQNKVPSFSTSDASVGNSISKTFDHNVKTLEKGVVSEYAHSQQMHQFVEKLLVGKCIAVVQTFGDQMLVAGPLGGHMGQHGEEQTHRAVREAFKLIQYLLQADHHFSGAIALETAVSVLTHADYPSFDMYGPVVSLARTLVAEAPTTMIVATERVANVYTQLRSSNPGMAQRSKLEVCPAQSWRIRAGGHHRVQRLQLKNHTTAGSNSNSMTTTTVANNIKSEGSSLNLAPGSAYKQHDLQDPSESQEPPVPSPSLPTIVEMTQMRSLSDRPESPAATSRSHTQEFHQVL